MSDSREKAVATLLAAIGSEGDLIDFSHLLSHLRTPTPQVSQVVSSSKALQCLQHPQSIQQLRNIPQVDGKIAREQLIKHLDMRRNHLGATSPSRRRELLYNSRRTPGQSFVFEKLLIPKKERRGIELAPLPWTSTPPPVTPVNTSPGALKKPRRDPEEVKRKWEEWKRSKDALARTMRRKKESEKKENGKGKVRERRPGGKELTFKQWIEEKNRQERECLQREKEMAEGRRRRELQYQQEKRAKLKELRGNIIHQKMVQRKLRRKNQITARVLHPKSEVIRLSGIPYLQKLTKTPKSHTPNRRALAILHDIKSQIRCSEFVAMLKQQGGASHPVIITRLNALLRAAGLKISREEIQALVLALPRTERRSIDFRALRALWRTCKGTSVVGHPETSLKESLNSIWPQLLAHAKASTGTVHSIEELEQALLHMVYCLENTLSAHGLLECCKRYYKACAMPYSVLGLLNWVQAKSKENTSTNDDARASLFNFFDAFLASSDQNLIGVPKLCEALEALAQGDHAYLAKQVEGTVWLDLMTDPVQVCNLRNSSFQEFTRNDFAIYWERCLASSLLAADTAALNLETEVDLRQKDVVPEVRARKVGRKLITKHEPETLATAVAELKTIDQRDLKLFTERDIVPTKRGMTVLGCLCLLLKYPSTLNSVRGLFADWDGVLQRLEQLTLSDFSFLSPKERKKIAQTVQQQNLETFIRKNEMAFFGNILRFTRIVDKLLPNDLHDMIHQLSTDTVKTLAADGVRRTSTILSGTGDSDV